MKSEYKTHRSMSCRILFTNTDLAKFFIPGETITVDEQYYPCRGCCKHLFNISNRNPASMEGKKSLKMSGQQKVISALLRIFQFIDK